MGGHGRGDLCALVYVFDANQELRPSLIAIRMAVAPIPVIPLHPVIRPGKTAIAPVLLDQVVPVGTVLAVIPGMVVMVVPIVVSALVVVVVTSFFLTSVVLMSGVGRNRRWCNKGRSQEQRADVSVYTMHVVVLQARDAQYSESR